MKASCCRPHLLSLSPRLSASQVGPPLYLHVPPHVAFSSDPLCCPSISQTAPDASSSPGTPPSPCSCCALLPPRSSYLTTLPPPVRTLPNATLLRSTRPSSSQQQGDCAIPYLPRNELAKLPNDGGLATLLLALSPLPPGSLTSSPLVPGVIGILRSFATFEASPFPRQPSFDYLSTTHPRVRLGRDASSTNHSKNRPITEGPEVQPLLTFTSQPDCGSERIIDEGFGLARPSVSPALQLVQQTTLD